MKKITKAQFINEVTKLKNEFTPVLGNNVQKENKKNSEEGVNTILKQVKNYNPSTPNTKTNAEINKNKNLNLMDLRYDTEPDKEWKERTKQMATVGTEKDLADSCDVDGNKRFYQDREKISDEKIDKEAKKKDFMADINVWAKKEKEKRAFMKECKPSKRLKFKATKFLSEQHLLSRVPESYKTDGNKFYMQDMTGTDYLIECTVDPWGYKHLEIVDKSNKGLIKEKFNRIKELMNYSNDRGNNVELDSNGVEEISLMLNKIRKLSDNKN